MARKLIIALVLAMLILPAAVALSIGGRGPGCHPDVDHDFRGRCFHVKRVIVNRTTVVHVRRTGTTTSTVTTHPTTTVNPQATVTVTLTPPATTATTTVTATTTTFLPR